MSVDATTGYVTVKIPASLASLIDKYLKGADAGLRGHKSRADVAVAALVDFMERNGLISSKTKPRLEHFNTYEDHATIRDNLLGRIADVYFMLPDRAYCELCGAWNNCIHVDYAYTVNEVRESLVRAGFRFSLDEDEAERVKDMKVVLTGNGVIPIEKRKEQE